MRKSALPRTWAVAVNAVVLALAIAACGSDAPESQPTAVPADGGAGESADGDSGHLEQQPARSGLPSSNMTCASSVGANVGCTSCPVGEICFTQVRCGPVPDGGAACEPGEGEADDRCHRTCSSDEECASGEECVRRTFFHCNDFNEWPEGTGICCAAGSGCR